MKTILGALNAKYVHSNLAIRYIKAYCIEYDIELFETSINDSFMETGLRLIEKEPKIVAFSCYIWNIEETLKVCSIVKEVLPNTLIILGGPEVTYNGTEYIEKYAYIDFVMQGEGEVVFRDFMKTITSGNSNFEDIKGLVFRSNNEIIVNKPVNAIENLDEIPFPYENELPNKIIYYEASRGCPFNCTYCLSGGDSGLRFFSLERVKKDLMKLINSKVELVKFVDRTFNAKKQFAMEIWRFLIENHGETKFHFEIGADLLTDDMLSLLKLAPKDLFQFEIGVQSTNIEVLKNINRVMDFSKVKANIIKLRENDNIHCHMDLIAGLPGENLGSFIKSFEDCMEIKPEVLQLGFLKILNGSRVFYEREKYGIHYINHPNYQVLYTKDMTFKDLRQLLKFEKVFENYYNSGIFNITINYLLPLNKSKFGFFMNFTEFLEEKGFFTRNIDLRDRFKMLYDFAILHFEAAIIKDLLLYDFIINTKKSVLPEFLKKEIDKNIKEAVNENKNKLLDCFREFDIKKTFALPVNCKVLKNSDGYVYEKCNLIVVFNLIDGEYCYL